MMHTGLPITLLLILMGVLIFTYLSAGSEAKYFRPYDWEVDGL